MQYAIEVENVSREFKNGRSRLVALNDVSLRVEPGEVVGLLGVNGAGKTTLTKILATMLEPTRGEARIYGNDVVLDKRKVRSLVSVVFGGERGLYTRLSAKDNLEYFGVVGGINTKEARARASALIRQVGLEEVGSRRVETFSKGMKQRLHVAIGLISKPKVLLLDEPTIGLDPDEATRLRQTISELALDGAAILLTSHNLIDVDELASRVVMFDRGRKTADMSLNDFSKLAGPAGIVELRVTEVTRNPGHNQVHTRLIEEVVTGLDSILLRFEVDTWSPQAFVEIAAWAKEGSVVDMHVRPARLDEAFASLVAEHVGKVL